MGIIITGLIVYYSVGQCPHYPPFPISYAYIGTHSMFSEPKSKSLSNVIHLLFPLHQKMSLCTINIIDGTVPSAMAVKEKLIWGILVTSVCWERLECRVGE